MTTILFNNQTDLMFKSILYNSVNYIEKKKICLHIKNKYNKYFFFIYSLVIIVLCIKIVIYLLNIHNLVTLLK